MNAKSVEEKSNANNELTSSLNGLMVVVENYPDLKSSQNFIQLSDELAGTENRIAVARKDYNDAVKKFNTTIIKFPASMLAGMFGFEKEAYFEADQSSAEVPSVNF
ncbi:LemA family protein [compost metagenome]